MSEAQQHYTFGDDDVAAQRLLLLAQAFAPSTRAWLSSVPDAHARACVLDLGCGPGATSALLSEQLAPLALYGLDQSERLLARARASWPVSPTSPGTHFVAVDVSAGDWPVPPADVLYARFLLTHLREPARVLARWRDAAKSGGLLLLEEVTSLRSAEPALTRYYELVERLQHHYGQVTYIGGELSELACEGGWEQRSARVEPIQLPAAVMARLHALNIRSWSRDPYAQQAFDRAELDQLLVVLERIADGAPAAPVECRMAQLVLAKP